MDAKSGTTSRNEALVPNAVYLPYRSLLRDGRLASAVDAAVRRFLRTCRLRCVAAWPFTPLDAALELPAGDFQLLAQCRL